MLGQLAQPARLELVVTRPSLEDLGRYASKAFSNRRKHFRYVWYETKSKQDFVLQVHYLASGRLKWQLNTGSGVITAEHWSFETADVNEIEKSLLLSIYGPNPDPGEGAGLRPSLGAAAGTVAQTDTGPLPSSTPTTVSPSRSRAVHDSTFSKLKKNDSLEVKDLSSKTNSAFFGELAVVHITNVLQTLSLSQSSGRLSVSSRRGDCEIYFDQGSAVHATSEMTEGLDCILQIVGWSEGHFHFQPGWRTDEKTITTPLSTILMQGFYLLDTTNYLLNLGVRNESILVRTDMDRSESEFEAAMAKTEVFDLAAAKLFYLAVNDRRSLAEIVASQHIPRSKWVPVVADLMRSGLIVASDSPPARKSVALNPKEIDAVALERFKISVSDPNTGVLNYPAFLFLLQHDLAVREQNDRPLSVIVLSVVLQEDERVTRTLTLAETAELNRRIVATIRQSDVFAHYDNGAFGLILSDTPAAGAAILAERLMRRIMISPLSQSAYGKTLRLAFGVAATPGDAQNMSVLLSAAETARDRAWTQENCVMQFTNIEF